MLELTGIPLICMTTCRIMNGIQSSGVLKGRLFKVAYNSKKHAIMTGFHSNTPSIHSMVDVLSLC